MVRLSIVEMRSTRVFFSVVAAVRLVCHTVVFGMIFLVVALIKV